MINFSLFCCFFRGKRLFCRIFCHWVIFMFNYDTYSVLGDGDCKYQGAISPPIFQTSTFSGGEYSYTRLSNPTRAALEQECALLEKGKYGFAFSSGLGAINALFSTLKKGDRVVVTDDIYGGTYRLINRIYKNYGINFVFADLCNLETAKKAITKGTALVFAETPTNPMMKIVDIAAVAKITHQNGGILAVDNTFLTPYFQNPLTLGADVVVHSATKYISGHHDVSAGIAVTNGKRLANKLGLALSTLGNGLSPFESWLVLRGLRTLPMRMEKHSENAYAAASFLNSHPKIEQVIYPAMPQHGGHLLCKRQSRGFGGVVSFYTKDEKTARKIISGGRVIKFAESLGGFKSLVTYPITQTHASIPKHIRNKIGINERLIRLSVGLENKEDIIADLATLLAD